MYLVYKYYTKLIYLEESHWSGPGRVEEAVSDRSELSWSGVHHPSLENIHWLSGCRGNDPLLVDGWRDEGGRKEERRERGKEGEREE